MDMGRQRSDGGHADDGPPLVDAEAAARRLGVVVETVRRLYRKGELPGVKVGTALRFDPRDLEAWIAQQKGR